MGVTSMSARAPRLARKGRARTDISQLAADVVSAVEHFRPLCIPHDEDRWAEIETFVSIALRVFAKTNPSKLRDAAMTEEIRARMTGAVVEDDTP